MCGIIGSVGNVKVSPILLQGLKNLEYRGYDSCGMAIFNEDKIEVRKDEGTVGEVDDRVRFTEMEGNVGIAHTRWATHGKVNQTNSHPHLSASGQFAVIHNGIISNYKEIKEFLIGEGYTFVSETDTEVAANLLEHSYKETGDVVAALTRTARRLEGTYAFLVLTTRDPEHIYAVRLESPLVIGLGSDANYIGSDANAFIAHTRNAVPLDDGEIAIIGRDTYQIRKTMTGELVERSGFSIPWDISESQKGGFSHYMLKEIHEQPQAIRQALSVDDNAIEELADLVVKSPRTYLLGVGTTFYVSLFGQYAFNRITGRFLPAVSSDEFEYSVSPEQDALVIAASQSGETYDTLRALKHAKSHGAATAAIVNVIGSSMSRIVDRTVIQGSGPEICVISTKAALAQMLILTRLAAAVGVKTGVFSESDNAELRAALDALPETVRRIINERSGTIRNLAMRHLRVNHWLFLGKGLYYPIALESALKMKEVSYIHSEGMPAGFLKHGTLALIDEKVNTLVFTPSKEESDLHAAVHSGAEEVKARRGHIVGFTHDPDDLFDERVELPLLHPLVDPLLQLVAGQLFSYFTAVGLGRNVDKPRSLAKSVTVP